MGNLLMETNVSSPFFFRVTESDSVVTESIHSVWILQARAFAPGPGAANLSSISHSRSESDRRQIADLES